MLDVMARMPDAFCLTDGALNVIEVNTAFVDLTHMASVERVRGTPLNAYIGRAGIDLDMIVTQVREHGAARNMATVVRAADGGQEDVEISAVSAAERRRDVLWVQHPCCRAAVARLAAGEPRTCRDRSSS